MAENIIGRVRRLISGTANSLIDSAEQLAPEVVIEESIREIDRAIDEVRAELGTQISKQHTATRRLNDANTKHEDLTGKIKIALEEDREDLAESAVAHLIDIEAQLPILELTIGEAKSVSSELENYILALQARKREMAEELNQFRATPRRARINREIIPIPATARTAPIPP